MNDLDRTLTQLENHDWGPPTYESHLVTECHRLRNVPLRDLGIEDVRLLIGQEIGLPYLVPIAMDMDMLDRDPWTEGDMYPGDLLKAVVQLPSEYWNANPQMIPQFQNVLDEVEKRYRFYQKEILPAWMRIFGGN